MLSENGRKLSNIQEQRKWWKQAKTYMEVTREFVHVTPSQLPSPQGSEPTQLVGFMFHSSMRIFIGTSA